MNRCDIVRDLIPLCIDDAASEASVDFVNTHLAACPECRKIMDNMKGTLQIPISAAGQLEGMKPFEKMKRLLTTRMIKTAVISVLVICAVLVLCFLSDTKKVMNGQPLLTEGTAAYQASLKSKAYLAFHAEEFPAADYGTMEPSIAVELIVSEEFSDTVYRVNVAYPIPGTADYPVFEMLIDPYSGDTLKTTVLSGQPKS